MVEEDKLFGENEDVLVDSSNEYNAHSIYVRKDACYILFVRETLHKNNKIQVCVLICMIYEW